MTVKMSFPSFEKEADGSGQLQFQLGRESQGLSAGDFYYTKNMCSRWVWVRGWVFGDIISSTTAIRPSMPLPRVSALHCYLCSLGEASICGRISGHKVTTVASLPFGELQVCLASLVQEAVIEKKEGRKIMFITYFLSVWHHTRSIHI